MTVAPLATVISDDTLAESLRRVREWAQTVSTQRVTPDSSPTVVLQAAGRHVLSLLPPETAEGPDRR